MRSALAVFGMLSLTATLSAADIAGTWVFNPAKSTAPNIISQTMKIEQTGPNTYKDTIDVVLKSGQKVHQEINRIYDGKEHPVTGVGITSGGTEICEQIDASTRKFTQKRDG